MIKRRTIVRVSIAGVLCIFSAVAAVLVREGQINKEIVNSKLYSLQWELDVLQNIYELEILNAELHNSAENMVISTILLAAIYNPDMSDLQGAPLQSLCMSLVLSKSPQFGKFQDDKTMIELTKEYLYRIEDELMEHTKKSSHLRECERNRKLRLTDSDDV